jgi:glycosyltransferase involved in cell wall biosynthesis
MPSLLLTLPHAARIGGVESYFGDLAFALAPLGWDVQALALPRQTLSADWQAPPYWDRVTVVGKPWWAVRDFARAVRAEIDRRRPDMLLTFAYDAPLISGPNIPAGPRVVEGVHTGLPAEAGRIRTWLPYFDALLAIGEGTRQACLSGMEGVAAVDRPPLRVIRYGLRLPSPTPLAKAPHRGPLRLIWFGRIRQAVKRVLDLIPIAEGLLRAGVEFRLTVLGEGAERAELRRQAEQKLPGAWFRLLDAVPSDQVFQILAGHDVFVSTSAAEGGPRTLLEAMSCNVVPVVTDIPGYCREVVEDGVNGFRVPVGDAGAFVDRIAVLNRDRNLLQRFAAACRPSVDPAYTVGRMARETDMFFREVLEAPPRRRLENASRDLAAHLPPPRLRLPTPVHRGLRRAAWALGWLRGLQS